MLALLLLAASATVPADQPVRVAERPATATVRIVRAAEVRSGRLTADDDSILRATTVRERDGSVRTASLIEFY